MKVIFGLLISLSSILCEAPYRAAISNNGPNLNYIPPRVNTDIELLDLRSAPQRQYGPPSKIQSLPQRIYGAPAKIQTQYGPPAKIQTQYGPPAKIQAQYGPPAKIQTQYGPPAKIQTQYGPPAKIQVQYGPPPAKIQAQYGPPSQPQTQYGPPPQPHADYGPPSVNSPPIPRPHEQYGTPAISLIQNYPSAHQLYDPSYKTINNVEPITQNPLFLQQQPTKLIQQLPSFQAASFRPFPQLQQISHHNEQYPEQISNQVRFPSTQVQFLPIYESKDFKGHQASVEIEKQAIGVLPESGEINDSYFRRNPGDRPEFNEGYFPQIPTTESPKINNGYLPPPTFATTTTQKPRKTRPTRRRQKTTTPTPDYDENNFGPGFSVANAFAGKLYLLEPNGHLQRVNIERIPSDNGKNPAEYTVNYRFQKIQELPPLGNAPLIALG